MTTMVYNSPAVLRPQTHHGLAPAPLAITTQPRPATQNGLLNPVSATHYTPATASLSGSAATQPNLTPTYRFYQQGTTEMSLGAQVVPSPALPALSSGPATAPPAPYFPNTTGVFDRHTQSMGKPLEALPPLNTASDQAMTPRYSMSASPSYADQGHHMGAPSSAAVQYAASPYTSAPPPFGSAGSDMRHTHVNPSVFNYMSRSASDGSDRSIDVRGRLVTPHLEVPPWSATRNDTVAMHRSDSDGGYGGYGGLSGKYYQAPGYGFDYSAPQQSGYGGHPQPHSGQGYDGGYAMGGGRQGTKGETEYEQERLAQIDENKKLMGNLGLGLGSNPFARSRDVTMSYVRQTSAAGKKRPMHTEAPVRQSSRLASMGRQSYAELDEGVEVDDEYTSDDAALDEGMWQPAGKRARHFVQSERVYSRKASASAKRMDAPEQTLYGLLQVYPDIPRCYPLFYYTLNNDLSINSDSVPLIGSIPSSFSPIDKAEALKTYFHRGRRVIAQIDAFTVRCDRKNAESPDNWDELDFHTRVAVRDVRRKVVERCENYKYTRRDLLDKVVGKNAWQPIEHGMIEWKPNMSNNDPAGDLANVHLTLPATPPSVHTSRPPQSALGYGYPAQTAYRTVRPMPSRARLATGTGPRLVSVNMDAPASTGGFYTSSGPQTGMMSAYTPWSSYPQHAHTPLPTYEQHQQHHSAQHSAMSVSIPSTASVGPMTTGMSVSGSYSAMGLPNSGSMQSMSQPTAAMLTAAPPTRMWTTSPMPRAFESQRSRSEEVDESSSPVEQAQLTGSSM